MANSIRVLAIEPYFGGSHRAFLETLSEASRHEWTLLTQPARHWKWRMRSAPIPLVQQAVNHSIDHHVDVVFCSDMLDLSTWLGLLTSELRKRERLDASILHCPTVMYFHENQWTYPKSPNAREDSHYGYTNLLSAIAADECWFNSHFHRDSFLNASESFVAKMPDTRREHSLQSVVEKSLVVPPGFTRPCSSIVEKQRTLERANRDPNVPLRIGWVSRWEYDKRPDLFVQLLRLLERDSIPFQLVLLGERQNSATDLQSIRESFGDRILTCDYAATTADYTRWLAQMDVVVSTADHEFFGIAICEAIAAGAAAVLPKRLCYPEIFEKADLYDTLDEAAKMISELRDPKHRLEKAQSSAKSIEKYAVTNVVRRIDELIVQCALKQ